MPGPEPVPLIPIPGWLGGPGGQPPGGGGPPGGGPPGGGPPSGGPPPPPDPKVVFAGFAPRPPGRKLDDVPGSVLTPAEPMFVTIGVHGDFDALPTGTHGDKDTKLLWTIDEQGGHFVKELIPWDSSRGMPSHTNISPQTAFFAGECWKTGPNEITISTASRAFGYNGQYADGLDAAGKAAYVEECQARYDKSVQFFREAGFEVKALPLGQR